jgi:hypothetical protein
MLRRLDWLTVLCMTGLAAGCGEVTLEGPASDAGAMPPRNDAAPGQPGTDAAPVEPGGDGGAPDARIPPDPDEPSLIAWYPLDTLEGGFTEDISGYGHHAQCALACPSLAAGQVGMAMDFGDVAHLRVDNSDGFFDTPDGFTIAAWVMLEEPLGSAVMSKMLDAQDTTKNSWQLEYSDQGVPAFTTANQDTHDVDSAQDPVPLDVWVHLAGTWDGATKRLYIDGVLEYELPFVVDFDGSDVLIGGDENNGEPALIFDSTIDEVRIYDRALDRDEILGLIQAR